MIRVPVETRKPYEVLIGEGILPSLGGELHRVFGEKKRRCAVISESTVGPLYAKTVLDSLGDAGYETLYYEFPAGEQSKNLTTYAAILEFLAENALTRSDLVIALGGGVTGDMAGFAAATYLRGIPFVTVPTTTLAAADASVGGKTAIDLSAGKNLVGAFHQPSLVLCDTGTFSSLPRATYAEGMAETIKHGLIADRTFFEALCDGSLRDDPVYLMRKNVEIKASLVVGDEQDRGKRQMLNFGHTIGHTIEQQSHFALPHGQAVALGMLAAARASYVFGMAKEDASQPIEQALRLYDLPTQCPYTAAELTDAALRDKKRFGDTINIIYLKAIGEAAICPLPVSRLQEFLYAGLGR